MVKILKLYMSSRLPLVIAQTHPLLIQTACFWLSRQLLIANPSSNQLEFVDLALKAMFVWKARSAVKANSIANRYRPGTVYVFSSNSGASNSVRRPE